jgi:hypothetical protein
MKPIEPTAQQHQLQRVLLALRQAHPGGTCLRGFGAEADTARNRVGDLRKLGWDIIAGVCKEHAHSGRVARYYLLNPQGTEEGTSGVSVGTRDLSPTSGRKDGGDGTVGPSPAVPTPLELFPAPVGRPGHAA